MSYPAYQIADYILWYTKNHPEERAQATTNLRLQYYVYLVNAFYYQQTGEMLVDQRFGKRFSVYKFGPAIGALYRKYCVFGGFEIFSLDDDAWEKMASTIKLEDRTLINSILEQLIKLDTSELGVLCRDDAWKNTKIQYGLYEAIPLEWLKDTALSKKIDCC